jgi:hypothetical protein
MRFSHAVVYGTYNPLWPPHVKYISLSMHSKLAGVTL